MWPSLDLAKTSANLSVSAGNTVSPRRKLAAKLFILEEAAEGKLKIFASAFATRRKLAAMRLDLEEAAKIESLTKSLRPLCALAALREILHTSSRPESISEQLTFLV